MKRSTTTKKQRDCQPPRGPSSEHACCGSVLIRDGSGEIFLQTVTMATCIQRFAPAETEQNDAYPIQRAPPIHTLISGTIAVSKIVILAPKCNRMSVCLSTVHRLSCGCVVSITRIIINREWQQYLFTRLRSRFCLFVRFFCLFVCFAFVYHRVKEGKSTQHFSEPASTPFCSCHFFVCLFVLFHAQTGIKYCSLLVRGCFD